MNPTARMKRGRARGFTMAELLVVIAIIVLLIGLLTPSLQNVRTQAKVTSSRATFGAIDTALATLKADADVGGAYPPSRSDNPNTLAWTSAAACDIESPFATGTGNMLNDDADGVSGAALLLMALAGADLQGTPGFIDLDGDGYWADDCYGGTGTAGGAYAKTSGTDATPYHTRYGPYVDLEKIHMTPKTGGTVTNPDFSIKAGPGTLVKLPVFLDAFGYPILYWRADPSAPILTGLPGNAIYFAFDNRFYTGATTGSYPGIDLGGRKDSGGDPDHRIKLARPTGGLPADPSLWDLPADRDTFAYYVYDPKVTVNLLPKNRQSYLLVSPGPDALYGTGDDIANFELNR